MVDWWFRIWRILSNLIIILLKLSQYRLISFFPSFIVYFDSTYFYSSFRRLSIETGRVSLTSRDSHHRNENCLEISLRWTSRDTQGLFFLTKLLTRFIFPLFLFTLKRKREKRNCIRNKLWLKRTNLLFKRGNQMQILREIVNSSRIKV